MGSSSGGVLGFMAHRDLLVLCVDRSPIISSENGINSVDGSGERWLERVGIAIQQ